MVIFSLVLLLTIGAQAAPPDQATAFESALTAARAQMEDDFPAAMAALDRLASESIELRRSRPLTALERPLHRDLFLTRARGYLQLLDNEKVLESFRELLRVDPFFEGTPTPRERELMDELRNKEAGFLEITSTEADATVLVNGSQAGTTGAGPLRLTLLAGTYEVRIEKEGYQAGVTQATVISGQVVTLSDVAPSRIVPPLAFLIDRDEVGVVIGGAPPERALPFAALRAQVTPAEGSALDQALAVSKLDAATTSAFLLRNPPVDQPLVVRFLRSCFIEESRTIAVTSASLLQLGMTEAILWFGDASIVRLKPDVGTLRVTSTPSDADIFLDNQLLGRTPFERGVCAGQHRVRVRHALGSQTSDVTVASGRTALVDATIKPGLAFLGALETVQGQLQPAADLSATVERVLASGITSYALARKIELPPEAPPWTNASAAELVAAADRDDAAAVSKLLRLATDNFDAPLVLIAVRRPPTGAEAPVDLLLFWSGHAGADRVRWLSSERDLADLVRRIDTPADGAELIYENSLGLEVVDTALPEAPMMIVRIDPSTTASTLGLKVGDGIEAVDDTAMDALQLAARLRERQPGDTVNLRVVSPGGTARPVPVPLRRRPTRAPVFDPSSFGNALIAKLTAASFAASAPEARDLVAFNLALVYTRFGEHRKALELLNGLASVPLGNGVGPGATLFFRGRSHEALGERDQASTLYQEASTMDDQVLFDDGSTVGAAARRRLQVAGG